jgi:hypothetical protein
MGYLHGKHNQQHEGVKMNIKSISEAAKLPNKTILVAVVEGEHKDLRPTFTEYLKGTVVERVDVKDGNTFVYFVAGNRESLSTTDLFEDVVTNINTSWVVANTPVTCSPTIPLTPVTPSTKIPTDVKVATAPVTFSLPAFKIKEGVVK